MLAVGLLAPTSNQINTDNLFPSDTTDMALIIDSPDCGAESAGGKPNRYYPKEFGYNKLPFDRQGG
jgi:hypothetical protein